MHVRVKVLKRIANDLYVYIYIVYIVFTDNGDLINSMQFVFASFNTFWLIEVYKKFINLKYLKNLHFQSKDNHNRILILNGSAIKGGGG